MQVLDLPKTTENIVKVLLLSFFVNSSNQYNPPFNCCTEEKHAWTRLVTSIHIMGIFARRQIVQRPLLEHHKYSPVFNINTEGIP
jgi:hypothetical protein